VLNIALSKTLIKILLD